MSIIPDFKIGVTGASGFALIIGSNLDYAAIHQLGGQAGKNKKVTIPARPYLYLTEDDYTEILQETEKYFKD